MSEQQSWCLAGELPKETAYQLDTLLEIIADQQGTAPPTLSFFEQPGTPLWKIEIFFPSAPDYDLITKLMAEADLLDWDHDIFPLEDKDWVSESQKLLAPVEADRFFVYGSHDKDKKKDDRINLQVDAGQAFGTGKHETTSACLEAISEQPQNITPDSILDLGTGSGLLALAAKKYWPAARVSGSDIDPIAIKVAAQNILLNDEEVRPDLEGNGIRLIVADGLENQHLREEAPFNLILANILAQPLINIAEDITDALQSDGTVILSGLLVTQEKEVLDAYKARGLVSQGRIEKGEWLALILKKP